MICFAKSIHFDDILALWEECFPGEDDFRDWYFDNVFDVSKTLICIKENQIAGMLQMLTFSSEFGDITYIYGAGTSKKFRKQGIMAELIDKSFQISTDLGHKFSFLIPASDELFMYYEKFGFMPNLTADINEHKSVKFDNRFDLMKSDDLSDVLRIYNRFCNEKFKLMRDVDYLCLQLNLFGDGAVVYRDCGEIIGYSFGYKTADCYHISEIFSGDISKCISMRGDEKIIYKTCGGAQKIGAIKSLCDLDEPFGYVNLLFN